MAQQKLEVNCDWCGEPTEEFEEVGMDKVCKKCYREFNTPDRE